MRRKSRLKKNRLKIDIDKVIKSAIDLLEQDGSLTNQNMSKFEDLEILIIEYIKNAEKSNNLRLFNKYRDSYFVTSYSPYFIIVRPALQSMKRKNLSSTFKNLVDEIRTIIKEKETAKYIYNIHLGFKFLDHEDKLLEKILQTFFKEELERKFTVKIEQKSSHIEMTVEGYAKSLNYLNPIIRKKGAISYWIFTLSPILR